MNPNQFNKNIRIFAILSFAIPLITINLCLAIYMFIGSHDTFPNFNWNEKKIEVSWKEDKFVKNNQKWTFTNCPKYQFERTFHTTDNKIIKEFDSTSVQLESLGSDGKIKSVVRIQNNIINEQCVKNSWFAYQLLKNFSVLEKLTLIAMENNASGFGIIKNPYLHGEVSISRTARYFPATLIFKPLIIFGAIFLFFYWRNSFNLFKELESKNILVKSPKKFYYLGVFSCIFLILHALFLGIDFDSELLQKLRRVIIILFILFEILAQAFLTRILFKFKEKLKNYINPLFLKIKIAFVSIIFFITFISFAFLIWGNLDSSHKHILEWNYFSALLIYYLLTFFFWRRA